MLPFSLHKLQLQWIWGCQAAFCKTKDKLESWILPSKYALVLIVSTPASCYRRGLLRGSRTSDASTSWMLRPFQTQVRVRLLPPPVSSSPSSSSSSSSLFFASLSWGPCPMSPSSSPTPYSLLPSLPPEYPQAPRKQEHPAKPFSVKCYQRKHLRTNSYTCCHPASWAPNLHAGVPMERKGSFRTVPGSFSAKFFRYGRKEGCPGGGIRALPGVSGSEQAI